MLAAQRYLRMLEMAEDPTNEFVFEPIYVVDYCLFAEKLKHFESGMWEINQIGPDGKIDPHVILEPAQIWVESAIQGFRRRIGGQRLVTTVLEELPRKNAKSFKAVVAALFDLCCSGGMAPEIPIAARSGKQADDTLFGDITKMVNNDEELREEFNLRVTTTEISRPDGGRIFTLTQQGDRQDGLNPSLAIFEEGHAGAASVYQVVDSAFGARPNGLKRMITTAGYRPEGPGYELLLEATRILQGKDEDYSFFAAIWALDREDYLDPVTNAIDWKRLLTDESLIERVNPMLDVSLDRVVMKQSALSAARRIDLRGEFARTRFNIWTNSGMTLIDPGQWGACYRKGLQLEDFYRQKCWIGVDLAQVLDMCAIGLIFELPDGSIACFAKFFLPEGSPTASDPDMADQFAAWADGPDPPLILTPGTLADHDRVREEVEMYCQMFDVQVIACDPAQAHNTVRHLWDGNRPVKIYPNNAKTMTAPTDDLLGRIVAEKLVHDNNPALGWNVQNVHGERKGNGSILPRKETPNSKRKIDGFVALCFANGVRVLPDEAKTPGSDEVGHIDPYAARGIVGFEEMTRDDHA